MPEYLVVAATARSCLAFMLMALILRSRLRHIHQNKSEHSANSNRPGLTGSAGFISKRRAKMPEAQRSPNRSPMTSIKGRTVARSWSGKWAYVISEPKRKSEFRSEYSPLRKHVNSQNPGAKTSKQLAMQTIAGCK